MRLRWLIMSCLTLCMLATSAAAVQVQYQLSTGNVTGVAASIPAVPGYGVLDFPGSAEEDIIWPVPVGCTAGSELWTMITDPQNATVNGDGMAIQAGLLFFTTTSPLLEGCQLVTSWKQLRALMDQTLITASLEHDLVNALAGMNTWHMAKCLTLDGQSDLTWSGSANCISWKANMDVINGRLPGTGQGVTLSTDMATLIEDAFAFKTLQGW